MKKIIMFLVTMLVSVCLYAEAPYQYVGIDKGNFFDGGYALISTMTATLISPETGYTNFTDEDWLVKNDGPYALFVDSYTPVSTSGVNMGYKLAVNEALSVDGRVASYVYLRALQEASTIYYIRVKSR